MRGNILSWFRQTHLYLGVFAAPAVLFFALTGFLQTFSLHENARDGSYKPAKWIVLMATVHKKQIAQMPPSKTAPAAAPASTKTGPQKHSELAPPSSAPQPRWPAHDPLPLKIFFGVVCVSLCASTLSGLYLSWKYRRNKVVLAALFLAGIVAPLVLMRI